jgi:hypothetical protein
LLQWKTTPKFTDWIYAKLTKWINWGGG